jgi:ABC-type amino acid transport substrate-binding protein
VLLMTIAEADAGTLTVLPDDVAVEPGAIMLRRKDPLFKQLIDQTLIGLMKNGEFARLYEQWFMAPIPLNGKNSKRLMLPMSDWLRQLMLTPNDMGL